MSGAAVTEVVEYLQLKIGGLNLYEAILLCFWSMMICCRRILQILTGDLNDLPELEMDDTGSAEDDFELVDSVGCGTVLPSTFDEIFTTHIWPRVMETPYPSWLLAWCSVNKTWCRFIATTVEWNALLIVKTTEVQYERQLIQTGEPRLEYVDRVAREVVLLKTMLALDDQERLAFRKMDPSRRSSSNNSEFGDKDD
ncbi:hypothetical protein R1sor_003901 [Riccia sorocarpa]|uniref:Uncharacterized protein n=1 Tax=Riccia sorocarpa TaxID=122646 RepID=A0ABD3H944_9MARC